MERANASDAELVEASRRGERAAFGELVERYGRMVSAISYASTRDRALGEDITQDTFVSAWRDLDRLRDANAVRPWLCGIARNLAHKARRRRRREVVETDADAIGTERTPFEVIRQAETEQLVETALGRVPVVYREALVLFYFEQRSTKDVAAALGVTEEVVHKRLSRGRQHLADGVDQIVERTLEGRRSRHDLAACVLAALPITIAVAPSHADAATKGSSMWKIGALGLAATTVAVGTVVAWPRIGAQAGERASAPGVRRSDRAETSARPARTDVRPGHRNLPVLNGNARAEGAATTDLLDCATVVRHIDDISREPDQDDDLGPNTRLEDYCKSADWSQETLACLMALDDMSNADGCMMAPEKPPELASPGADVGCAAVAENAVTISTGRIGNTEVTQVVQHGMLRALFEAKCTDERWSETRRSCYVAARNPAVLGRCADIDVGQPAPAPPSADVSCIAVARHGADLLAAMMLKGDLVFHGGGGAFATINIVAELEDSCTKRAWSEQARRCVVAATSPNEFLKCAPQR
jgi:RNA polymerase sigma factor (sigma-70 family)